MAEQRVFQDRILKCVDCNESFVFSAGEQSYFDNKGLTEPKRCKQCRILRKRTIGTGTEVRNG